MALMSTSFSTVRADAQKGHLHRSHRIDNGEADAHYASVLRRCGNARDLAEGKRVHASIVESGHGRGRYLANLLVQMYGKCGSLDNARAVFDEIQDKNVFSWSIMIGALVQNARFNDAIHLFRQMDVEGVKPDSVAFVSVLTACSGLERLSEGRQIHDRVVAGAFETDNIATILVKLYGKCGSLDDARKVFDGMNSRDVIAWTAMISAYARYGHGNEAIELLRQMDCEGAKPDEMIFSSLLGACACIGDLAEGRAMHARVIACGLDRDVVVHTATINMYANCGSLSSARKVFDAMPVQDASSWTAMIGAYAQHGHAKESLVLFRRMEAAKLVKPDKVTFATILQACSHAGLIEEGRYYFRSMSFQYGIAPTSEHYVCMIDLLGRAGRLDEAEEFIKSMPIRADGLMWRTLLGACRLHADLERGVRIAKLAMALEPENDAGYVLLSNMYSAANGPAKHD